MHPSCRKCHLHPRWVKKRLKTLVGPITLCQGVVGRLHSTTAGLHGKLDRAWRSFFKKLESWGALKFGETSSRSLKLGESSEWSLKLLEEPWGLKKVLEEAWILEEASSCRYSVHRYKTCLLRKELFRLTNLIVIRRGLQAPSDSMSSLSNFSMNAHRHHFLSRSVAALPLCWGGDEPHIFGTTEERKQNTVTGHLGLERTLVKQRGLSIRTNGPWALLSVNKRRRGELAKE